MRKPLIGIIILLAGGVTASSQGEHTLPSYTSVSNNSINCITEDEDNYIWIGTNDGANRYNGSIYRRYSGSSPEGLSHSSIKCILPDKDGKVWIGAYSGINLIRNGEIDPSVKIPVDGTFRLEHYDEDRILFSGRKSLNILDKNSLNIYKVYEDERITYNDFTVTQDGNIWLNQLIEPAFIILDSSFNEIREIRFDGYIITGTVLTDNGEILVLTNRGILRHDSSGRRFPSGDLERFTNGKYVLFYEERPEENEAWIGIRDSGIFRKDSDSGTFTRIWDKENLSDANAVIPLVTENGLYLSLDGYGLKYLSISSMKASFPVPQDGKKSESLNIFYDMGGDNLLILTNKDIYRYNRKTRATTRLEAEGISGQTQINISAISKNSHLWLVYGLTELREYEFMGDRLRLVSKHSIRPTTSIWTRPDGSVQLLQDDKILSFHENGAVTSQILSHPPKEDFWYCGQTISGKPFMLSSNDIYMFDFLSGEIQRTDISIPSPSALYEDRNGIMWIGSKDEGVFRYDPITKEMTNIGTRHGLSDPSVRSIIGDVYGNIWVATPTKVSRIDSGGNITMFNIPSEITRTFSTNSALALPDGHVMFGSLFRIADYCYINPVEGKRIKLEAELDGLIINGKRKSGIHDRIVLNHKQNSIAFYYSVKNFNPDIIPGIEYKLEGYDKEWIPSADNFRAGYSGIKSGGYAFRIRLHNPDGSITEEVLVPEIKVRPHPMLSWPVISLYIMLLLLGFYLATKSYIDSRVAHSRLKMAEQEKILVEQIAQERMDFFKNISNELLTPLGQVYNSTKELNEKGIFDTREKNLIGSIKRSTERMIVLTDQLLTFNKERDLQEISSMITSTINIPSQLAGLLEEERKTANLRESTIPDEEATFEEEMKPRDKAFINKMHKIVDEHLSDESFGVTALAEELGMSRTSVFSKIKSLMGMSPQAFLNNYRLNKAMELLKAHEMNISEVAYKVGFSTLTGFSRSFKNKFGVPPSTI